MSEPTRALSIRQPWAWMIVNGFKDIENRDWPTRFRGPVLIHASKWFKNDEVMDDLESCAAIMRANGLRWGGGTLTLRMLKEQTGGIVGQANIIGCVSESPSPWFFGKYGFQITSAKALPLRPLKGALGFFGVTDAQADH